MKNVWSSSLLVVVGCALISNCGTTKVKTSVKLPPRIKALRTPQTVYVTTKGFGRSVASTIRTAVGSGGVHSVLDDATVAAGNAPSVLVEGYTLSPQYGKKVESEKVKVPKKCVKRSKKGKKGKKKCIKWKAAYTYYVYTLRESCRHGVHAKLTDATSGSVLQEKDYAHLSTKEKRKKNKAPDAVGSSSLCALALSGAVSDLKKSFCKYRKSVVLVFADVSDSDDVGRGIEAAELGRISKSKELFLAGIEDAGLSDEDRAWTRYNLAVAHEALDEFADCLEQLEQAADVLGSDDKLKELRQKCDR